MTVIDDVDKALLPWLGALGGLPSPGLLRCTQTRKAARGAGALRSLAARACWRLLFTCFVVLHCMKPSFGWEHHPPVIPSFRSPVAGSEAPFLLPQQHSERLFAGSSRLPTYGAAAAPPRMRLLHHGCTMPSLPSAEGYCAEYLHLAAEKHGWAARGGAMV